MDIGAALGEVDALAAAASERGGTAGDLVEVLRAEGFRGDRDDYDNPSNSFLHHVLARRRGLPILLSALTIAAAERMGQPVAGVGLPGHFVVADRSGPAHRYLDAFDGWVELPEARLAAIVRSSAGTALAPEHLAPVSTAAMVRRMLLNLRGSYLRRRDLGDALWTVELEAIVEPDDPAVRLQHRALLIGLGRYDDAEASAAAELAGPVGGDVRAETEAQLTAIAEMRLRMN